LGSACGAASGGRLNGIDYFGYHIVFQPKPQYQLYLVLGVPPSTLSIQGFDPTSLNLHQIGYVDNSRLGKFSLHTVFKALPRSLVSWAGELVYNPPIVEGNTMTLGSWTAGTCIAN
jgi:hypothetical protein